MSEITEGLAEIGQGALVAGALEGGPEASGEGHTHESACLNCGTALVGSHCHACGQAAHVHRTLGAFFHDLLHGVFHFEGKIWRTLPLLAWQPGRLTREYIDGRRASYISPIALFLFFVFLMFAVFHATANEGEQEGGGMSIGTREGLAEVEARLADLEKKKAAAQKAGTDTAALDEQIVDEQKAIEVLKTIDGNAVVSARDAERKFSDVPAIDEAVHTFRANPELVAYKAQTYAYKYSWLLIPISVPFVWLLFPFSRRFHLYDHTVFVTYSLCFMTLLVIATMLAGAAGATWVGGILFFVPPFHMYRQLRGTYALGRRAALWRTVLLAFFASTALMLFFLVIVAQTGG